MPKFGKIWTGTTSGSTYEYGEVINVVMVPENQKERGFDFLVNDLGLDGVWVELPSKRIGRGHIYDETRDYFRSKQPHPSWSLDIGTGIWTPPTEYPDDGLEYYWDEDTLSWIYLPPPIP
jgi:hypothetical protein